MIALRLTLTAALLAGATLCAFAVDTKPVVNPGASTARGATTPPDRTMNQGRSMQNNAQAGTNDMGGNAAMGAQSSGNMNTQTAMNSSDGMGISSAASPTQRKGMHLSARQRAKADSDEAETTRQLNQQAASMAAPSGGSMR